MFLAYSIWATTTTEEKSHLSVECFYVLLEYNYHQCLLTSWLRCEIYKPELSFESDGTTLPPGTVWSSIITCGLSVSGSSPVFCENKWQQKATLIIIPANQTSFTN